MKIDAGPLQSGQLEPAHLAKGPIGLSAKTVLAPESYLGVAIMQGMRLF